MHRNGFRCGASEGGKIIERRAMSGVLGWDDVSMSGR